MSASGSISPELLPAIFLLCCLVLSVGNKDFLGVHALFKTQSLLFRLVISVFLLSKSKPQKLFFAGREWSRAPDEKQ